MVCLDTTFLIDLILGRTLPKKFDMFLEGKEIASVTTPSIVEIIKGIYLKKNVRYVTEEEKKKIKDVLDSLIILNLDKESAILAGEIEAELRDKGEFIEIMDILIAAIVIRNGEILLTKNEKHFKRIKNLELETY